MQKRMVKTTPLIMSLKHIDSWNWCRYFIDLTPDCPYRCCYCNTRKTGFKGVRSIPGLPQKKVCVGLGLLADIYHPDPVQNETATEILEILSKHGYTVNIMTKSPCVLQDAGILEKLALNNSIRVTFTILTLSPELSRSLEGTSPPPYKRLEALSELNGRGIPCGVAITPVIPSVNDDKDGLASLVEEAYGAGAGWVLFSGFNPVQDFFLGDRWPDAARIHNDDEELQNRYRRVRNHLVRLIHERGLKMRIPRMIKPGDTSAQIGECLFNISHLFELLENPVQSTRYRRAASRIEQTRNVKSIVFRKKLGYIKGINPEIERVIEEILYTGKSGLYDRLHERLTAGV